MLYASRRSSHLQNSRTCGSLKSILLDVAEMPVVFQYSAKTETENGKTPVPAASLVSACSPLLLLHPLFTELDIAEDEHYF